MWYLRLFKNLIYTILECIQTLKFCRYTNVWVWQKGQSMIKKFPANSIHRTASFLITGYSNKYVFVLIKCDWCVHVHRIIKSSKQHGWPLTVLYCANDTLNSKLFCMLLYVVTLSALCHIFNSSPYTSVRWFLILYFVLID